jgi:hypothetical protein
MVYAPFSAGQILTASDLNTLLMQETMAWTPLASLGSFGANFSANATRVPMMRKVMFLGTEVWHFKGSVNASAFAANSTLTVFTFTSTTNWVLSEREIQNSGTGNGSYSVRLGLQSAGTMTASVPTAASSGTNGFWIDGEVVDPLLAI